MGVWKALEKCPLPSSFVGLYKPQRGRIRPSAIIMHMYVFIASSQLFKGVCVCVCVRACVRASKSACVCVCVCVCEGDDQLETFNFNTVISISLT